MELKQSIESVRDFAHDALQAGKLAVANTLSKIDEYFCDYGNEEDQL